MQPPDFEFVEAEKPLPPALQLAQDALSQTRAYHQNLQTRASQLADATPPSLTYAGQSQGQPLLRTPEGNLLRAGARDSNGALLAGVVDIVSSSGVVRVGGMPRVKPQEIKTAKVLPDITLCIQRRNAGFGFPAQGSLDVFLKDNGAPVRLITTIDSPPESGLANRVYGAQFFDKSTFIIQVTSGVSFSPSISKQTVLVLKSGNLTATYETTATLAGLSYAYPDELSAYTAILRPDTLNTYPPVNNVFQIAPDEFNQSAQPDYTVIVVFEVGYQLFVPTVRRLLQGVYCGVVRGKLDGTNDTSLLPYKLATQKRFVQLTEADLAVFGLNYDSPIRLNSPNVAPITIGEFKESGSPETGQNSAVVFYDENDAEYNTQFIRGYANVTA